MLYGAICFAFGDIQFVITKAKLIILLIKMNLLSKHHIRALLWMIIHNSDHNSDLISIIKIIIESYNNSRVLRKYEKDMIIGFLKSKNQHELIKLLN